MTYIDLPSFLYEMDKGVDITLIGLLTGYIEAPSSLSALSYKKGTKLGKLELVGVQLHVSKGDGTEELMNYFCKGEVPILVDEYIQAQYSRKASNKLGVKVRGGVSLARGSKRRCKSIEEANLVVGFRRYTDSSNIWCASPYRTTLVSQVADKIYYDVLLKASKVNWDLHSVTGVVPHDGYTSAGEGAIFKPLMVEDAPIPIPTTVSPSGVREVSATLLEGNKTQGCDLGVAVVKNSLNTRLESTVADNKDISELLKNRVKEEPKVTNRLVTVPKSGGVKELETLVNKSKKKVDVLIDDIKNIPKSNWSDAIEYMALGLSRTWATVGKALFVGTLVKLFPKEENKILLIESVLGSDFAIKWGNGEVIEDYEGFCTIINNNANWIYLSIIDTVLKLGGRLSSMYFICKELDICLLSILHRNPYYLGVIDVKLSIEEIDLIAILYGVDMDSDIQKLRNAVIGHLYILNSKNRGVGSNTLMKKGYLYYNLQGGKILNKSMYDVMVSTGKIITEEQIKTSKILFAPTLKDDLLNDSPNGYIETYRDGVKKYLKTSESSTTIIDDYVNSGLGIMVTQEGIAYVCDYVLAEMEIFVYDKLYALSKIKTSSLTVDSSKLISEFEYIKSKEFDVDFKLEMMQKQVTEIAKLNTGCLTGCAGSGKTTTAELLLYCLEKGTRIKSEDIVFVAPTGRASARLREVVKRKASTIHSYFGIKDECFSIFNSKKSVEPVDAKVIVADEMSMCNIYVMYNMLKRVHSNTRLYLIGDKEQLSPIGFGKPFVNALHYLPTVLLDVSKRASEGSGITLNAEYLVNTEEGCKALENKGDFRLIDVEVDDTVSMVLDICKYHLGLEDSIKGADSITNLSKISMDSIQIVTPVNKGVWGTRNLNKQLQRLFNPRSSASVVNRRGKESEITFKVGDRVIHTENYADTVRLESLGNGTYKKVKDDMQNGVMNGDIGKIVAIHYAKDMHFIGAKELTEQYKGTNNTYYVSVEYEDIDTDTAKPVNYYVLYGFESGTHTNHMEAKTKRNGLGVLDLAYALTTHKLQGSQSDLILYVVHKVGRKGFISRNMLYTGITRAKEGCYVIGNVSGRSSAIGEGRMVQQVDCINTTVDKVI